MRRFLFIIMALCLLGGAALAEIPCQCGQGACQCFIQLGDKGPSVKYIEQALIDAGFLINNSADEYFDQQTLKAVLLFQEYHRLAPTGMMDDETLTLLLWGMIPEELDALHPETSNIVVWIPTDGGIRHHDNKSCCNMLDPRLVSQRNALAMEMLHCGRCKPPGYTKK